MTAAGTAAARGTAGQRLRAGVIDAVSRLLIVLPERPVDGLADLVGEAWYRIAPARASLARRNLERVVRYLAAEGLGGSRVATAAVDGQALERLVRAAFRQAARYYLDVARLPGHTADDVERRLVVETPETVATAFLPGQPVVFVGMHFGQVEFPALFSIARTGRKVVAPMETLGDPALQAWITRTRATVGVDIIPLRNARRTLAAALADGRSVGLVADRNIAGGAREVPFFGAPALLPIGPALLAVESGRPLFVAAVRNIGAGRYGGQLHAIDVPTEGSRRERVTIAMRNVAAAMERSIAAAPDQWFSVLSPVWPDIDPRALAGTGHLEVEVEL
jgi:KDO2-lipid IV(A) lauroyltransferase